MPTPVAGQVTRHDFERAQLGLVQDANLPVDLEVIVHDVAQVFAGDRAVLERLASDQSQNGWSGLRQDTLGNQLQLVDQFFRRDFHLEQLFFKFDESRQRPLVDCSQARLEPF